MVASPVDSVIGQEKLRVTPKVATVMLSLIAGHGVSIKVRRIKMNNVGSTDRRQSHQWLHGYISSILHSPEYISAYIVCSPKQSVQAERVLSHC